MLDSKITMQQSETENKRQRILLHVRDNISTTREENSHQKVSKTEPRKLAQHGNVKSVKTEEITGRNVLHCIHCKSFNIFRGLYLRSRHVRNLFPRSPPFARKSRHHVRLASYTYAGDFVNLFLKPRPSSY